MYDKPSEGFSPESGEPISVNKAQEQLNAYRKFRLNHPNDAIAHFIGKERLKKLLERSECVGIRVYYGIDEKGNRTANFFAVDKDGRNIRIKLEELKDANDEGGYASTQPCPEHCPPTSGATNNPSI